VTAPEFLYHYTTLESLACILKHATFRFTRIDLLNDPLDGLCSDVEKARKHIFVSSWTANSDDQIPMWRMYTGDMTGVRIGLPSVLFSSSLDHEDFDMGIEGSYLGCKCEPFPVNCSYLGMSPKIEYVFGPLEIFYENSEEEVVRKCSGEHVAPTGITVKRINLNNLGDAKIRYWQFEQEWRFRVYATPTGFPVLGSADIGINVLLPGVPVDYIDVPINKKCLSQLEILIGPRGTEAHEIIVASLTSKYAPNARVAKSKIRIARAT
jgi:hypothetical protein